MGSTTTQTTSQAGLAELLEADRTTIRAMQRAGLPFVSTTRGKTHRYVIPLAMWWAIGYRASRRRGVMESCRRLVGVLDPLAFALAADGDTAPITVMAEHLRACGHGKEAEQLPVRVGRFQGHMEQEAA